MTNDGRRLAATAALIAALALMATSARADDEVASPEGHKGQLGLSLQAGLGLRAIATYDSKYYCGTADMASQYGNASVCTGRAPFAFDLGLEFGITRRVELLTELRLGLERDFGPATNTTNGPRTIQVSPGARLFFSETSRSKLFVQGQLVIDFTGYNDPLGNSRGKDFGVRGAEGIWLDLHRAYGVYLYASETAEFSRWLLAQLELGIGFQARYP